MARAALKVGGPGWQGRRPPDDSDGRGRSLERAAAVLTPGALRAQRAENDASPVPPRSPEIPADDQGLLAALDGALDALAPPAFVVGPSGRILRANGPAHEALGREGTALRRSLAAAVAPGAADPMWDVTPLRRASGAPVGFLAIRRPPSRELAIGDALRIASRRWKLTARQLEVLDLAARGFTNDVIAERLRISKGTVEFHLTAIFDKAGVCNRATLIVRMFELE